ncbi:ATP-binding cassette domain-containing protein [Candidatus Peregrinibacteria bacterium]|nr:ATP-binding cassette domain-containing protein [Candidatus Peregrinibacteria bacterium]
MIEFKKAVKKYGTTKVLDEIDLNIKPGEFVSVIGPSGAGKSTLVYALIGAEKLSSGVISVDGFRINRMNQKEMQYYRRRIGVVFQDYRLLPQKTVFENIAFALEVCGYREEDIRKLVLDALHTVGLNASFGKRFPHQISGGEKQRCAIARALVHGPGLIIADEPTGNLDPDTGLEIIKLLEKINQDGITVILTTHNKDLVNFLKKRVIKIDDGKIVSDKGEGRYE